MATVMKGMTAAEIIKACPPRVKLGAQSAQIIKAKPLMTKAKTPCPALACLVCTTHFLGDGPKPTREVQKYKVMIEGLEPNVRLHKSLVKVSCECPDFWATWEVALKRRGAASIQFSNGQKPVVKNPSMVPGCCKHLYSALKNIITFKV